MIVCIDRYHYLHKRSAEEQTEQAEAQVEENFDEEEASTEEEREKRHLLLSLGKYSYGSPYYRSSYYPYRYVTPFRSHYSYYPRYITRFFI